MKTITTPEQIKAIVAALEKMHVRTFQCESCDPTYNAQRNTSGRTHYFDADTLKFHKSRVLSAHHQFDGLLFAAVCSDSIDGNGKRGFRYVVHDVFGTCLDRPKLEDAASNRKAAEKQFEELEVDLVAHYQAAIERERKMAADKLADCDAALALLVCIDKLTTKQQAEEYVKRVGVVAARNSNHYRTAGICHCETCFCCEVVKAVKSAEKAIN